MRPRRFFAPLLLLSLLAAVPAQAHDLLLAWSDTGLTVLVGHLAGAEHDAPSHALADTLLRDAWALTEAGAVPLTTGAQPLACPPDALGAVVRADWGPRAATPAGRVPLAEARPAEILATSHARANAAALRGPLPGPPACPDLFLLPLRDPTALSPGDKIRVRVLRDGSPCAGATVLVDGSPRGETGDDGELNVKIRRAGAQLLQAVWRGPDPAGAVDELVLETSLTFTCGE